MDILNTCIIINARVLSHIRGAGGQFPSRLSETRSSSHFVG